MTYNDTGSIEHLSDGHVKARTKCISRSSVERTINSEEVTKKAACKIEAGYVALCVYRTLRLSQIMM
jgi:hypothetical protein